MSAVAAQGSRFGLLPLSVGWLAVLLWGGSPIATRFAVLGIDPTAVGLLRTVIAGVLALPLLLILRLKLPGAGRPLLLLLAMAAATYILFPVLFSIGVRHTTASHAALVHASTPLFTGSIAAAFERRLPGRWWCIGVAVALIGEVLLIGLARGFAEPGVTLYGDLVVFASCLVVAFGYVAGGWLTRAYGSLAVTFWAVVLAAVAVAPVTLAITPAATAQAPAASLGGVAYLAVISSIVGYVAWNWALAHGGIGRTGVLQFAQPLLTVLLAVLLLGESVTPSVAAAGVVILAGVSLARRRGSPAG
jgi:drug/metabolite transporter (DMT)-like permease